MAYTLDELIKNIGTAIRADGGPEGRKVVAKHVSNALVDRDFVAYQITVEEGKRRRVLYEDPDLGFCVCAHVYAKDLTAEPHDHGATWAIYGTAEGTTEMTEWRSVRSDTRDGATLVEPVRTYAIKPGECHVYEPGDIHSPVIAAGTKLIRIEGANLDHVRRSNIKAV